MILIAGSLAVFGLAVYALVIEPGLRLRTRTWRLAPPGWTRAGRRGPAVRIVVLSDFHVSEPHMPIRRVERIVSAAMDLRPDLVVLLGDYDVSHPYVTRKIPPAVAARVVARLSAPLGVYSILGNHDWWEDEAAQSAEEGPLEVQRSLEAAGIPVLENEALAIGEGDARFWLAGLGDQLAIRRDSEKVGRDDVPAVLGQITDDAPAILLAHEPDIFPDLPDRFALTISGHTHGGQVRIAGWAPVMPSRHGQKYGYGHVRESGRDIVISGGLGCSIFPLRFNMPPEITVIELS